MSWKETSPGTFSRPVTPDEICFMTIGGFARSHGREPLSINLVSTITPYGSLAKDDIAPSLRRGWAHLRFRQPMIAATCSDNRVTYTVPNTAAAFEEWMQQSFFVLPDVSSSAELTARNEKNHCQLYYIPKSNEVLLFTTHWQLDGVGTVLILGFLLQLAFDPNLGDPAALQWGEEATRFNPTVQDVIPAQGPMTATQEAELQKLQLSWQLTLGSELAGIPYQGDATTPPNLPVFLSPLTLTPETTTKIIEACKQRRCTVTSAVHASLSVALFAHQLESHRGRKHGSLIEYNMRRFLPEKYQTPEFAVVPYLTGWGIQVPPGEDWEGYCRIYQSHYSRGLTQDHFIARRELMVRILTPLPDWVPNPNDPASGVILESLGVLDKWIQPTYGSPERGCVVHTVTPGIDLFDRTSAIYVSTFRGRLSLNPTYNQAYHSSEQMMEFVKSVADVLLKELHIEE